MSKKKSYMDRENILSEGFLSKLIKIAVPASLLYLAYDWRRNKKIKKLEKDIEQHGKNIKDADARIKAAKVKGSKALDDLTKFLSKETGTKITKQTARKAFRDYTGK